MRSNKPSPWILAAAGSLVCACSGEPLQIGSVYVKSELVTASAGGTLVVDASDSVALAGTRIEIPAGALQQDTEITIAPTDAPLSQTATGPALSFGPDGTQFNTPITITLPTSAAGAVQIFVRNADTTTELIPASQVTLDEITGRARFNVSHFTDFEAQEVACAADADCPAGNLCASGVCEDDCLDGCCAAANAGRQAAVSCGGGECAGDATCPAGEMCWGGWCAAVGNGNCVADMDCAAGEVCASGVCEVGCGGPGRQMSGCCMSDADCATGEACVANLCEPAPTGCAADADCPTGEVCEPEGPSCGPAMTCVAGCRGDAECSSGVCNQPACLTCPCPGYCDIPPGACTSNNDCAAGEACVNGVCQAGSTSCRSDLECAAGESCVAGFCAATTTTCTADTDCPTGEVCEPEGPTCGPAMTCVAGCRGDAECSSGVCNQPACLTCPCPGYCDIAPGGCSSNADCAAGQLCAGGSCAAVCNVDADCATVEICLNGICTAGP